MGTHFWIMAQVYPITKESHNTFKFPAGSASFVQPADTIGRCFLDIHFPMLT